MYDAIVVGAGPGGAASAAWMARGGMRVLLVDKAAFPREKVCGDAVSGKSVEALQTLGLVGAVEADAGLDSWGIVFGAATGEEARIPFTSDPAVKQPPGYLCRRERFDALLFEEAVRSGAEAWQESTVEGLLRDGERVVGVRLTRGGEGGRVEEVRAPLVVGADGAYSAVARQLGMAQLDERHYYASVRTYYEGVTGFQERNFIELHFVPEAAPGYFWIFPLPDGRANVGLVVLSSRVKRERLRLKEMLDALVAQPRFRARFEGARRVGPVRGWGLPLGSKPRRMAGDGWMLVGDAASLIDPFTGEGIGNALVSGLEAGRTALATPGETAAYEASIHRLLGRELRLSRTMLHLCGWKWPLSYVIRKAARSREVAETITAMFDDLGERRRLVSPLFYLRLLAA